MSMVGLVGSDVYLPVLPEIGNVLHKNPKAIQFTLSVYLTGLSFGQLIFGPLTDHFGRKKLVIIGMLLCAASSISCALCISYSQLIISRFFQAVGASSGLIIGRAIVGDLFNTNEAGKIFSIVFLFIGISPAISPMFGGFIGYYLGWESTFIFVALIALIVMILVFYFMSETLTTNNRQTLHLTAVVSLFPKLLLNKKFIAYCAAPCAAYFAYFAYITQSPFIFHAHGFGEREIGAFYITLSITYVTGNLIGRKLINHIALNSVIGLGFVLFNIGSLLLFIFGLANFSLIAMVMAVSVLTLGNGFLIPFGTAGVVGLFPKSAGYASGLLGFLQLGCATLSSSMVGIISENSIAKLGAYIFVSALTGTLLFIYYLKKSNDRLLVTA